jgi:hypothetical protein
MQPVENGPSMTASVSGRAKAIWLRQTQKFPGTATGTAYCTQTAQI